MAETRATKQLSVTIASGAAVSEAIDMTGYAAAIVIMPAAWTAADLGVKVSGSNGGTFAPLLDWANGYDTNVSIDGAAAGKAYPMPLAAFAAPYIQLWSHDGAGADTAQDAARTLTVLLKA